MTGAGIFYIIGPPTTGVPPVPKLARRAAHTGVTQQEQPPNPKSPRRSGPENPTLHYPLSGSRRFQISDPYAVCKNRERTSRRSLCELSTVARIRHCVSNCAGLAGLAAARRPLRDCGRGAVVSILPVGLLFALWHAQTERLWPLLVAHGILGCAHLGGLSVRWQLCAFARLGTGRVLTCIAIQCTYDTSPEHLPIDKNLSQYRET